MRRKRKFGTVKVSKYKAELNAHRRKQEYGIKYWETFAPVGQWTMIKLLISLVLIQGWYTRKLDFVSASHQVGVKEEIHAVKDVDTITREGSQDTFVKTIWE